MLINENLDPHQSEFWVVNGITFYTNELLNDARKNLEDKQKVLFAFGPWVGELSLELTYWSSFIRYLKKEVYPDDLFLCQSFPNHKQFYTGIDFYVSIKNEYTQNMVKQYGPNAEYLGDNPSAKIFEDFIQSAWDLAHINQVTDVIVVVPTTKFMDIILGLENHFSEYLTNRMDFSNEFKGYRPNSSIDEYSWINDKLRENYGLNLDSDKYICIFASDYLRNEGRTWSEDSWNALIDQCIVDLGLKVVLVGDKKISDLIEGSLYLYNNSLSFISLIDFVSYYPGNKMDIFISIIKNSQFCVCATENASHLISWCKVPMVTLFDKMNLENFLYLNKKLGNIDKIEFNYSDFIENIALCDVKDSVDNLKNKILVI